MRRSKVIMLWALVLIAIVLYEVAVFRLGLWLGVEVIEGSLGMAVYLATIIALNAVAIQIADWGGVFK